MSTSPGTVDLQLILSGITQEGGPIGPLTLASQLAAQAYSFEVKDFRVPASAALPGTPTTLQVPAIPAGLRQSLFLVKADQPISLTLNGGAVIEQLERSDRLFLVMSSVPVTQIDFGNLASLEARVYVLQMVEPTT